MVPVNDRDYIAERAWTRNLRIEVDQAEHYAAEMLKNVQRPNWLARYDAPMIEALKRARSSLDAALAILDQYEFSEAAE